ncbi:TonB-dependent receptor [Hydrocarboniphaga sp.]|uniref:TonB-dependent receptor n=1 Tax=Hydrocarboniphaga sp. TaxID=2033016 RepID=UPI003D0D2081
MRLACSLAVVASLLPIVSVAQEAPVSQVLVANTEAVELETVIVTGEKLQRDEIDTTTSVGVRSARQIEESSAQTLDQVISQMANVSVSNGLAIRGIPLYGPTSGDGKVATISVDGVSQEGYSQGIDSLSVWDVDQAEVLRGPQSTNQGRNSLAGAVILSTADPTDYWDFHSLLSAGNQDATRVAVAGGGPLIANLAAFRVSFERYDRDGSSYNETRDDDRWNHSDQQTLRGKLSLTPFGDRYRALLTLVDQKTDNGDGYVEATTRDVKDRISLANDPGYFRPESRTASLEQIVNWDHASLTLLSTYLDSDRDSTSDYDETEYELGNSFSGGSLETFTQEVRSNFELPLFGRDLKGVAGLYYADEDTHDRFGYSLPLYYGLYATGLCGSALSDPNATLETCQSVFSADPEHFVLRSDDNTGNTRNQAAYFEFDYPVGVFTLTAGLRYDREKHRETLTNDTTGNDDYTQALLDSVGFGPEATPPLSNAFHAWLPKAGLRYGISEDWVVGLTFQRGYRAGGTSYSYLPASVGGGSTPYGPEFTNNYELSLKGKPTQRTTIAFNAYHIDWTDQQVNIGTSTLDTHIVNAGRSRLQGLEFEGRGFVSPQLELFAALGLSRTEYREFLIPSTGEDYSGNQFLRSPRTTASAGATWKPGNWLLNANVVFEGSSYSTSDNNPDLRNGSHTLCNARAAYQFPSQLQLFVYALNLLDETYTTYQLQTVGGRTQAYPGEARLFGAGVEWRI